MMGPAVVVALLGLMHTASAFTPRCAMIGTCGKPTSTFPKLDKAACEKKFPTLDSFTCDVWDATYPVCAALGGNDYTQKTFPNKCSLERYVCNGLMAGGKASATYLYDGRCTMRGAGMCFLYAVPQGAPQVCAQLGNDPPSKANLQVFKNSARMSAIKCSIPLLKTVKMDVCKAAGVALKPRPPMPKYEKTCMEQSMKCDYKLRGAAVCGSDGITYPDACNLYYDNCIMSGKFGKAAKLVKLAAGGACPLSCDQKTPCPSGMDCIGTCVPSNLDKCATMKCAAGTECKNTINRKLFYGGGGHPFYTKCMPKPAAKCDVTAMTTCLRVVLGPHKSISPCGVLVASAACAVNTNCVTAAKRFCTTGVLINVGKGGSGQPVLPKDCAAPACKNAVDKKCQAGAYNACAHKTYSDSNLCRSYTSMAKCISQYNCDEDLEATCYMAKWDGCKSQELKTVCKNSQTPIKELTEEHYQVFQYARLQRQGSSQSKSNAPLMAGVGCVALLAVGLAAFVVRRRRQSSEEAPAADYQAVEEEI